MAKFKKALALVLSLAMVLTLAPISSVKSEAASKYKIKAATTAIAAGKTYNVKVTGVKKGQYVKVARSAGVTVKYNKKTIKASKKVAGTGKTLTFKVTVPDKVANYNSTIKAVIYNKKTNKKVKTLSTKRTVNVTKLEVTRVELASSTGKYLVAYFSKKLDDLKIADITIREKDTDIMKGVESVSLSSDGKSATVALVGSENTTNMTTVNSFVEKNKDYIFSVTQNGVTASTTFTVDDVWADEVVVSTDASKRTINGFIVPASIDVDFEDILGRTVTFWFDKNLNITKLVQAKENVVISSFSVTKDTTAKNAYLTDLATGQKYYTEENGGASVYNTRLINRINGNRYPYNYDSNLADGDGFEYAKLVLNSTGTIRSIVGVPAWDANEDGTAGAFLVGEVSGNLIKNGKSEVSLKDYTIIDKDGKTTALTNIAKDDVVFYNTNGKFAQVYTASATGALTAVIKGGFTFEGKTYKLENKFGGKKIVAQHFDAGANALVAADDTYMESLKKGGENITVYTNYAGFPLFIAGKQGEVDTTSVTIALVKNAAHFQDNNNNHKLEMVGVNGSTNKVEKYTIDPANLTSIKVGPDDADETKVDGTAVKKFTWNAGHTAITKNTADGATVLTLATQVGALQVVTLTLDKKTSDVVGISRVDADGAVTKLDNSTTAAFKAGYKTLNGAQVTSGAGIYVVDKTEETGYYTTYGKFTGQVANNRLAGVLLYTSNNNVGSIVIDKEAAELADADDNGAPIKGVVAEYQANTDKSPKTLTILVGKETVKYDKFKDKISVAELTAGDIVTVTPSKTDATQVNVVATADLENEGDAGAFTYVDSSTVQIGTKKYTLAKEATVTIAKVVPVTTMTNTVDTATLDEMKGTKNVVNVSFIAGSNSVVDTVVLTGTKIAGEEETVTDGLAVRMTTGKAIAATPEDYKKVSNGVDITFVPDGFDSVKSVQWYEKSTSGLFTAIAAGGNDAVLGNAKLTAGNTYYAKVVDANGNEYETEKVVAVAPVAWSLTRTEGSTNAVSLANTAEGNAKVTILNATITVSDAAGSGSSVVYKAKDQFGIDITGTACLTIAGPADQSGSASTTEGDYASEAVLKRNGGTATTWTFKLYTKTKASGGEQASGELTTFTVAIAED